MFLNFLLGIFKDKSSPNPRFVNQQVMSPNVTLNTSIDSSMSYSQAQLTMHGMPMRYTKLKGKKLYLQQFNALIMKRFHHHRRNFRVLMTNLLLPCFFVALSMAFTAIKPKVAVQPSLEMSPSIYNPNSLFFTYETNFYLYLLNTRVVIIQKNYYSV